MIYSTIKIRGKFFTPMGKDCQNTRLREKRKNTEQLSNKIPLTEKAHTLPMYPSSEIYWRG